MDTQVEPEVWEELPAGMGGTYEKGLVPTLPSMDNFPPPI